MFSRLREDIAAIRAKDPAARSAWEVLTCYPGVHALMFHRVAHACWSLGLRWLARMISQWGRFWTGIEIHPAAKIGRRVFIDHGMGVVIGQTAEVGDDCTIYQGVTLGGTSLARGTKRHPTLGPGVIVGAGAQVLGGFTVGEGAKIGSNAVVVKPVPAGATAVGNPARIIAAPSSVVPGVTADAAAVVAVKAQHRDDLHPVAREFAAYGVTPNVDDPTSLAINGLIEHVARQASRVDEIVEALERLGANLADEPACSAAVSRLKRLAEAVDGR
ncbi:MAG TPA: serine O-acetyltransferase [Pararobbsia sp.]|nr:serine O-acetyltransferase [Pararobbsia sp.]